MTLNRLRVNRAIRILTYVIELVILYIIQETPGALPPILGARPILTVALAITVSLLEKEPIALMFGVLAGLSLDVGLGTATGSFGIVLAVMCCLVSSLAQRKIHVTLGSTWLTGIWSIGIIVVLLWLIDYVFLGYSYIYLALINNYLPIYIYTILVMPIVYILNLGVYTALKN